VRLRSNESATETEKEKLEKRGRNASSAVAMQRSDGSAIAPGKLKASDLAFLKTDPGAVGLDSTNLVFRRSLSW
jgi:hypothetical protein